MATCGPMWRNFAERPGTSRTARFRAEAGRRGKAVETNRARNDRSLGRQASGAPISCSSSARSLATS